MAWKARSRGGSLRCLRMLAALAALAACALQLPQVVYKMYPGPARPGAEIAVIELADAGEVRIGPRRVKRSDYARVHLLPGPWHVEWNCFYVVSVTHEMTDFAGSASSADVELEAGHTYSLLGYRTSGRDYLTFQWMRDDTTGRIVAGTPKP